jgi:hypothetical protein
MSKQPPATLEQFNFSDWLVLAAIAGAGILGVLHVLFGLREVLGVLVHPATAAWVQAVGAIGAIGIAIWVAHSADRNAAENARITAKHFIKMASAAVGGLSIVAKIKSEEADVQRIRFLGELSEVQLVGRAADITKLSPELCACVLAARRLVARAYDLGVDIQGRTPAVLRHAPPTMITAPRDGHSIALALLNNSHEELKELDHTAESL